MQLRADRVDRAMRILSTVFGTPANQQKGHASVDAAAWSAATLLASHMCLKMGTAEKLVRRWYATANA
jgi:hypothetical protein